MIYAIEVIGSGGVTKIFKPTGVIGEWECELQTVRGPEPGGLWQSYDVVASITADIYDAAGPSLV